MLEQIRREEIQKVLLVMVDLEGSNEEQLTWELEELSELVATAGGQVVGSVSQRRAKPDIALLVGKGKAEEIAQLTEETQANLVVFNLQLSPAQIRNLEEVIPVQVLDRNQLILDIFAQRANSMEGKLQVELAQLQYMLPRLTGRGVELSRLGGGIGTRGPGETKLETDRRRIRNRIDILKGELAEVEQRRALQRKSRERQGTPLVALVGYTNAGKTSLLRALTGAERQGEDKLFATLDTTVRQLELPNGQRALLSDTVGFIQQLPPQLVKAFRATLEETLEASLILHVIDASHPQLDGQVKTVNQVLADLGANHISTVAVLNKIDVLREPTARLEAELVVKAYLAEQRLVSVSALEGTNLDQLLQIIQEELNTGLKQIKALVPYTEGQLVSFLKDKAGLQKIEYLNEGIWVEVLADQEIEGRLKMFMLKQ